MEARVGHACTAITQLLSHSYDTLSDFIERTAADASDDEVELHLKQYGALIARQNEIVNQAGFARWSQFSAAVLELQTTEPSLESASNAYSHYKSVRDMVELQRKWDEALLRLESAAATRMPAPRRLTPGEIAPPVRLPSGGDGQEQAGVVALPLHTDGPVLLTFLRHYG